ncbi:MAG: glutathione S-transferase family protein [Gammaproteobacteria bacterium]|nr:glutathione S-transferase family protein [Gammaproteobacteria bacterium]
MTKENMTPNYAQINPNMVVPALVHDGQLYLESMDIIEYLDQAFGGDPFVPVDATARIETMALVEQAKELHQSLRYVSFRWSLGRLARLNPQENKNLKTLAAQGNDKENLASFYDAYSNEGIAQSIFDDHLLKLYKAFSNLNTQLSDGRKFLMGESISIAGVFWSMKILRLIETGYLFSELHPVLYDWFLRMYKRPAFQTEVMANNRMLNRVWQTKATIERTFGFGLNNALHKLIAA